MYYASYGILLEYFYTILNKKISIGFYFCARFGNWWSEKNWKFDAFVLHGFKHIIIII